MTTPQRLPGRVVDADGKGIADATVAIESGSAPTPEIGVATDADGRFVIALPDGSFRIAARSAAFGSGASTVSVPADKEVRIVLSAAP